jgi:hypothetical protein
LDLHGLITSPARLEPVVASASRTSEAVPEKSIANDTGPLARRSLKPGTRRNRNGLANFAPIFTNVFHSAVNDQISTTLAGFNFRQASCPAPKPLGERSLLSAQLVDIARSLPDGLVLWLRLFISIYGAPLPFTCQRWRVSPAEIAGTFGLDYQPPNRSPPWDGRFLFRKLLCAATIS